MRKNLTSWHELPNNKGFNLNKKEWMVWINLVLKKQRLGLNPSKALGLCLFSKVEIISWESKRDPMDEI